jgi:hypothetical protein
MHLDMRPQVSPFIGHSGDVLQRRSSIMGVQPMITVIRCPRTGRML